MGRSGGNRYVAGQRVTINRDGETGQMGGGKDGV